MKRNALPNRSAGCASADDFVTHEIATPQRAAIAVLENATANASDSVRERNMFPRGSAGYHPAMQP
jgi:hypothetical protein